MSWRPSLTGILTFTLGGALTAVVILGFQWVIETSATGPDKAASVPPGTDFPAPQEEQTFSPTESQTAVATQDVLPEIPANAVELDPAWVPVVMDALKPRSQGNPNKNQRLMQIALVEAKGVPSVQETCLRHLTFSLSNEEVGELYKLAVNQTLPLSGRKYLVDKSLRIRSPEVAGWMAAQLIRHPEPEIAKIASRYMERQQRKAAADAQESESPNPKSTGPF